MGPRRIDIRTSRKSNRQPEPSPPRLRKVKGVESPSKMPKIPKKPVLLPKPQKILKKKVRKHVSKPRALSPTPESLKEEPYESKPKRRRVDASDYIKRRFLYEDELTQRRSLASNNPHRSIPHVARSRISTASLVATSSAYFIQRKRKRRVKEDSYSLTDLPPIRSRRGRKPKQRDNYVFSPEHGSLGDYSSAEEQDSAVDEQAYSDAAVERSPREYSKHDPELDRVQDSGDLLKPLFRKTPRRSSYQAENRFSPEPIQNPPDYMADLPDFFLNNHMTDLTRSRGPVVLSKRARHRIMPRPPSARSDFMRNATGFTDREFNEFPLPESETPFRHSKRSFALDQLVSVNESHRVSGDGAEWNPSTTTSTVVVEGEPSKQVTPRVDVEEFAGDLMPQRSVVTNFPPSSGSSRRKSPVRPMQVLRNEPLIYHSESGSTPTVSSAGAALIQQRHIPQTIYGHGMGGGSGPTGLVELCAAAGLDSGGTGPPTSTDAPSQQPQPTVISNPHSHKYSLINQNIVSLQPNQMFVDVGARQGISGYTVSPTIAPLSRISIVPGRYSYGPPFQCNAKLPHQQPSNASKTAATSGKPPAINPAVRRRPSILKRGGVAHNPASTPATQMRKIAPINRGVRTLPLISPSVAPRLAPPFMRAALRASPLQGPQTLPQQITYAIVSANPAPLTTASPPSVRPQTASSRLFGPRRSDGLRSSATAVTSTTAASNAAGSTAAPALTLISCLPTPNTTNQTATGASPVRYAVVRGATDGKKYVFLSGGSNAGFTGLKTPLQSLSATNNDGGDQQEVAYAIESGFAPDSDQVTSNQNLPPEHTTTVAS